jgi:hypothetical protein
MYRPLLAALLLLAPVARAAEPEEAPAAVAPSQETEKGVRHDTDGAVQELTGDTERFSDPGRTRYLLGHSALMLRGGEGFVSQRGLLFSVVAVGLSDHVTLSVGSALPALAMDSRALHVVGGLKVGGSVSERLHLAVGAETVVVPFLPSTFGLVYGAATYGIPDAQLTLSAGVPFAVDSWQGPRAAHFFTGSLGGSLRLSKGLAAVTENWVLMGPTYRTALINSLALRILGESWTVDLGGVYTTEIPIPLPWLSFSWHWR